MSFAKTLSVLLALFCLASFRCAAATSPADVDNLLMMAVGSGDTGKAEALIAQGANVNAKSKDDFGRTPLMEAVANVRSQNMRSMVQALLAHGADLNAQDNNGTTPLMFAVDLSSADLLLSERPDLTIRDKQGRTALLWAISQGSPPLVAALLTHGADASDADKEGETALMMASEGKSGSMVIPLLLAKGVAVDGRDSYGQTALIYAAGEDLPENIRLLLRAGANVNARTKGSMTPLLEAAQMYADLTTLKVLLQAGAAINVQDSKDNTALKYSLRMAISDEQVATFLLQHGANPNLADSDGDTPMIQAISAGHAPNFLTFLVTHGAKLNAQDKAGQTALMVAAGLQDTDSIARLLLLGADTTIKDKDGATALFYAVTNKYGFRVQVSIESPPNQLPDPKTLPFNEMMLASLKILQKQKTYLNVRDKDGKTVLAYAKAENHLKLVAELEKAGAKE